MFENIRGKVFIDTNILTYCSDGADKAKQDRARQALHAAQQKGAVISTQVLQEFYVVATRKLGIEPPIVKDMLRSFKGLETVVVDPDLILLATDCSVMDQVSFWDALILVAAEKARCSTLFSEDLNSGQRIRGVLVLNPLTDPGQA